MAEATSGPDGGTQAVSTMQYTQQLVCILHVANPGVPGAIFDTIAEAEKPEDHWESWIRWMKSKGGAAHDGTKGY